MEFFSDRVGRIGSVVGLVYSFCGIAHSLNILKNIDLPYMCAVFVNFESIDFSTFSMRVNFFPNYVTKFGRGHALPKQSDFFFGERFLILPGCFR